MLNDFNLDLLLNQFYLHYIPMLAAACLVVLLLPLKNLDWQTSLVRSLGILIASLLTYGFYWLDQRYGLWSGLHLQYNSSTALAMSLVIFLVVYARMAALVFILSLVAYLFLVVVHKDASFLSVATIGLITIPLMTALFGLSTLLTKRIKP